ncbi:hypothetical protein VSDG_01905 [Cytospora chrysosperma]|uniref:Uncharacterized protein n=1 Tax=Cytospora chrysosperma TaxID=252740 RepID=A0A423WHP8_CYTCH|nr:hypothetical protein VSDG_01905 [Valsa sordida]
MPSTRRTSHQALRRDSWPPTQMPLRRIIETESMMDVDHDEDLSLDDDPINFFLTPTPLLDDGDTEEDEDEDVDMEMDLDLEMNMAFDAGIENPHDPQPAIRSISPSDLTGPTRPPSSSPKILPLSIRSPTPPKSWSGLRSPPPRKPSEATTPNTKLDDDDDEDYVRFTPRGMSFNLPPFNTCNSFGSSKSKGNSRKAAAAAKAKAKAKKQTIDENDGVGMMMAQGSAMNRGLLSPTGSFHVGRPLVAPSTRGRSTTAVGRPPLLAQRPRSWSGATGYSSGRLSPRAWREPSPDVWSIEEEPEEEPEEDLMSEVGDEDVYAKNGDGKTCKKVRFLLPVTEVIP